MKVASKDILQEDLRIFRELTGTDPDAAASTSSQLLAKVKACTDIDIKADVYHAVGLCFHKLRQFDKAKTLYFKSLELRRIGGNKISQAQTLNNIGIVYFDTRLYQDAIPYYLEAIELKQEFGDYKSLTATYGNLGNVYLYLSEYQKAMEVYYKSLKIAEEQEDVLRVALTYQHMGTVQHFQGDERKALSLYKKARKMQTGSEDKIALININSNIGLSLYELRRHKEALGYFEQCLEMSKAINYRPGISVAANNMAYNLKELGKLELALNISKQCLESAILENEYLEQCTALKNIGEIFFEFRNYPEAKDNLTKALKLAKQVGNKEKEGGIYQALSKLYEKTNDPGNAFKCYKKYVKLKGLITNAESNNRISQLQTQYEVAKKDDQVKAVKLLQVESELKALRAQMDPHFIFNALNSIRTELLEGNNDKADHYLVRFSKLLRLILDTTRTPLVKLSDNIELLNLYLQIEQSRQSNRFSYRIQTGRDIKPENIYIPGMILQPLAENALIHGLFHKQDGKGRLDIGFSKAGMALKIKVSDNGVGRKGAKSTHKAPGHQSHATSIIRETLALAWKDKMEDRFFVIKDKTDADGKPAGTEVTILLPFSNF